MKNLFKAGAYTILLLAGLMTTQPHAMSFSFGSSNQQQDRDGYTTNRPWGNLGPSKPAKQYQPPQPPLNSYGAQYLGAAPATGWYQGQIPAGNSSASSTPVVEVEVGNTSAYEHQNIIYTVHVVSEGNIAVLDDRLPRIEGATLDLIDGPVATTRGGGYNRANQIVNTYRYRLTPLRAGEIVVPAIRFTGRYAVNNPPSTPQGTEFDIQAASAMTLQVEPADPAVRPWLPLHDLRLQTRLDQDGRLKAGQPVTLTLELTARGAPGTQLPSLAGQLQNLQYRVYRGDTRTSSGISANGRYVTGNRTETYTLIPLEDGWIRLPNINVAWWDVDSHEARLAGIPPLENGAVTARQASAGATSEPLLPLYAWLPMAIAAALIAGYLLGAWQRTRGLFSKAHTWFAATGRRTVQGSLRLGKRLAPAQYLRSLRVGFAMLMPSRMRLWMCTRCIASVENPRDWCAEFRARVCQDLHINGHSSLTGIADHIIASSPRVEPARLRELVGSLEAAIYGGKPLDFPAWKQELKQQLRPGLLPRRRTRLLRPRSQLPALNPQVQAA